MGTLEVKAVHDDSDLVFGFEIAGYRIVFAYVAHQSVATGDHASQHFLGAFFIIVRAEPHLAIANLDQKANPCRVGVNPNGNAAIRTSRFGNCVKVGKTL